VFSNRGNVIIFRNGIPAQTGTWQNEVNPTNDGNTYNVYLGACSTWVNKGDGGWDNWGFEGSLTRNGAIVTFNC